MLVVLHALDRDADLADLIGQRTQLACERIALDLVGLRGGRSMLGRFLLVLERRFLDLIQQELQLSLGRRTPFSGLAQRQRGLSLRGGRGVALGLGDQ